MPQDFSIRPFKARHEAQVALAALDRAVWPDSPTTAALLKHRDAARDPQYLYQRLVVTQDDALVAVGEYGERALSVVFS